MHTTKQTETEMKHKKIPAVGQEGIDTFEARMNDPHLPNLSD